MSSDTIGPGLRTFREAIARGAYVDVRALLDEYPAEALVIVDELQAPTARDWSMMRERAWLAFAEVERDTGKDSGLGVLLQSAREERGSSVADLVQSIQARGVDLDSGTFEQLEASQGVDIDPEVWAAVVEELGLDRHHVVANIRRTLSPLRAEGEYLSGAMLSREPPGNVADYLDRVRVALGIPTESTHGEAAAPSGPTRADVPTVSPAPDLEDAIDVQAHIDRIFAAPPDGRTAAIRQLFVEDAGLQPGPGSGGPQ